MAEGEQPLSKESFDNNADLLVFPDRHEYRTRSRAFYRGVAAIVLFGAGFGFWFCYQLTVVFPKDGSTVLAFIATPIFFPISVILLLLALTGFRTNPWIVISPAGVAFHNRLQFPRLRAQNFLVTFDDIYDIEIVTRADRGGRYEPEPMHYLHRLQLCTDSRGDLPLKWDSYSREQTARFVEAFLASIQEMKSRAPASL